MSNEVLERYFGLYLGTEISRLKVGEIRLCQSERRIEPEVGWGYTVPIWLFLVNDGAIVSVSPNLERKVEPIIGSLRRVSDLLDEAVQKTIVGACATELRVLHQIIYAVTDGSIQLHTASGCRRMEQSDIPAYIALKQFMWPELDAECETLDMTRNVEDRIAYAVFEDGQVVSAASAPKIGHMQAEIEEIGIDTHPDYRNRGYAKAVLSRMTQAVRNRGGIPVCRPSVRNKASLSVIRAVGYQKFADSIEFIS